MEEAFLEFDSDPEESFEEVSIENNIRCNTLPGPSVYREGCPIKTIFDILLEKTKTSIWDGNQKLACKDYVQIIPSKDRLIITAKLHVVYDTTIEFELKGNILRIHTYAIHNNRISRTEISVLNFNSIDEYEIDNIEYDYYYDDTYQFHNVNDIVNDIIGKLNDDKVILNSNDCCHYYCIGYIPTGSYGISALFE
jgi:hypothetical protein